MLVTRKNEYVPVKNKSPRVATKVSHYIPIGIFPVAQGWLTQQFVV